MSDQKRDGIEVSQSQALPDVVDDHLDSGITVRAPSQAAVSRALNKKQNLIESTDEIKEGVEHLYFREERALDAVMGFVMAEIKQSADTKQPLIKSTDNIKEGQFNLYFRPERVSPLIHDYVDSHVQSQMKLKQDPIESTDQIKEGYAHLYFTNARARNACICNQVELGNAQAPTSDAVARSLLGKQNQIRSSDDISEGRTNLFFKEEVVRALIEASNQTFQDRLREMSEKISDLTAEIESLKPKWSDQFMGGSGKVRFCASLNQRGAKWGFLTFDQGRLVGIEIMPTNSPVGPGDP